MKDYSKMSSWELIKESENILNFQNKAIDEFKENTNLIHTQYKMYTSLLEKCSDWLTFMVDFTSLTEKENEEFDDLISAINNVLGR